MNEIYVKNVGAKFMNSKSYDSRFFPLCLPQAMYDCDENRRKILESSEVKFMNLAPYVFERVAKIRSGLSISILEKKNSTKLSLKGDIGQKP